MSSQKEELLLFDSHHYPFNVYIRSFIVSLKKPDDGDSHIAATNDNNSKYIQIAKAITH